MTSHAICYGLRGKACQCGWKPPAPCSYIGDDGDLVMPGPYTYIEENNLIHAHIREAKKEENTQ